jgi:glutaredoxin-like protein NrdH
MKYTHQDGKNVGRIVLFALSTCIWCKKTKELLNKLNVAYDYIDVDLAAREEKHLVRLEMKKWGDKISYPFIVVDDKECIRGFKEDRIREVARDGG